MFLSFNLQLTDHSPKQSSIWSLRHIHVAVQSIQNPVNLLLSHIMLSCLVHHHKHKLILHELSVTLPFEYFKHSLVLNLESLHPRIPMTNPKDDPLELHLVLPVHESTLILQLGNNRRSAISVRNLLSGSMLVGFMGQLGLASLQHTDIRTLRQCYHQSCIQDHLLSGFPYPIEFLLLLHQEVLHLRHLLLHLIQVEVAEHLPLF